jgi:YVTN family beta-propeller protein
MFARVRPFAVALRTAFIGLAVVACASGTNPTPPATSVVTASPSTSATPTAPTAAATLVDLDQPTSLATEGSTIWAIAGAYVARIDTATRTVKVLNIGNAAALEYVAATPEGVWASDFDGSSVTRIDPATDKVVARMDVAHPEGVLPVGSNLWVANHHEGTLTVIDARTNEPTGTIMLGTAGSNGPHELAAGAGSIWVNEANENQVVRLTPDGKVLAKIAVPGEFGDCGGILATTGAVWVTGCHETSDIVRIDPTSNAVVAKIQLAWYAQDAVDVGGFVWVPTSGLAGGPGELDRIDPATNRIDRRLTVAALTDVGGAVVAAGDLWVSNTTDAVVQIPLAELTAP